MIAPQATNVNPSPALAPAPNTSMVFVSEGLGLTREEWEAQMGSGEPDVLPGFRVYGDTIVTFIDDKVIYLERQWADPVSSEIALAEGVRFIPKDSQQLRIYSPDGRPETIVHLFNSPSLALQFDADSFILGSPGDFTVQYNSFEGEVQRMIVGLGNNPSVRETP
jgi:hypothetical protein